MSSYLNLKQAAYNLNVLTNASYRGATVTICSKNPCCFKLSRNTDQNHDKVYRLAHQTLIRISKHSEGKEALLGHGVQAEPSPVTLNGHIAPSAKAAAHRRFPAAPKWMCRPLRQTRCNG